MGEVRRFRPNEKAVFPSNAEGFSIVRAVKTLPPDTPDYTDTLGSILDPHIPARLDCVSELLRGVELLTHNVMAQLIHLTEGGLRRRRESGRTPDSVATLNMSRKPGAALWLASQAVDGEIDPPWAPEVLARLHLMGTTAVAEHLGLHPTVVVRNLKTIDDPTFRPMTFVQGNTGVDNSRPAWIPEQFANYPSPAVQ